MSRARRQGAPLVHHERLVEVIRSCAASPTRRYTALVDFCLSHATQFDIELDRDPKEAYQTIADILNKLRKGYYGRYVALLLAWLAQDHREQFLTFVDLLGLPRPDLSRLPSHGPIISAPLLTSVDMVPAPTVAPFRLRDILASARSSVIIIAQNQWYLTGEGGSGIDHWPSLRAALERGVKIDIAAMSSDAKPEVAPTTVIPDAIALWGLYMMKPHAISRHFAQCWAVLTRWIDAYDNLRSGNPSLRSDQFCVYASYFSALSMMFVDHDEEDAYAIISPRTSSSAPGDRPQFIIRRKLHPGPFSYYFSEFDEGRSAGGWTRVMSRNCTTAQSSDIASR